MTKVPGFTILRISRTQYHNFIRGTAVDAMSYDYDVTVITDYCSAKTPKIANFNIIDMKNMGIECVNLEELLNFVRQILRLSIMKLTLQLS